MATESGVVCYKGFRLVDGVPICDKYGKETEYRSGTYVSVGGPLVLCENGIHVCLDPMDCLRYYFPSDADTVIGVVEAFEMSKEEDTFSTKRVTRAVQVHEMIGSKFSYSELSSVVKRRAVGTRTLSGIVDTFARPHTDVITYDNNVWSYGFGWCIGDADDILMSAGRSCCISCVADVTLGIAMTFGIKSVSEGVTALAFATCSMARTMKEAGVALTVKDMSIAVAESAQSLAVTKGTSSRAVANDPCATAVAMQADSLVMLNHPGCVGVTYGSAMVNAKGCTVILMPGIMRVSSGRLEDYFYSAVGTIQGVDGTVVMLFDPISLRWLSVTLRKNHPSYPSDRPLDLQWLVADVRRKANENHS